MAGSESFLNWIFTDRQLEDTPSRRDRIAASDELLRRQSGTALMRDIADVIKLRGICVNSAIVYFHRFFMFRSFKQYDSNDIAVCALFLASKFEEQPKLMEDVIRVSYYCRHRIRLCKEDKEYKIECDKLIENENEMLLILGFDLRVSHSQAVIGNAYQKSVISKEIGQNAFRIANELIRLTTLCLRYESTMIACIAIYFSRKLFNQSLSTDWCKAIDANISLKSVEENAKRYEIYLESLKSQIANERQRKRSVTCLDDSSPESAYSSGSNTSPDYDGLGLSCSFSSTKPMNSKLNSLHSSKTLHNSDKRFCADSRPSTLSSSAKSSLTNSSATKATNSSIGNNNSINKCVKPEIKTEISATKSSSSAQNDLKHDKHSLIKSAQKAIASNPNGVKCMNAVNAKQAFVSKPCVDNARHSSSTESPKIAINGKTISGRKCFQMPQNLNFKITVSNVVNNTLDASSVRVVRECPLKSEQSVANS